MHEKICDIQNSIWKAYSEYRRDLDIVKYQEATTKIVHRYKDNRMLLQFCQNMLISWTPIINEMKRLSS